MASVPAHRIQPQIHKPEPRFATKRVGDSVHVIEQGSQRAAEEQMRQSRHVKSSSLHVGVDGPSLRKTTYARAKSTDSQARHLQTAAAAGGSIAALKAAQMSANAHTMQEHRTLVTGHTQKVSPYLAAASKAWSNSAAKEKTNDSRSIVRAEIPSTLWQTGYESGDRKSSEFVPPLQTEFILPVRSGGRSKSHNSDLMVQEINNYVNAEVTHQGPLQAARLSFAQDREAHANDLKPPSRPTSTLPVPHPLDRVERQNTSAVNLPWTDRHNSSPPPLRKSTDTHRAALSAASLTWASHEHDNPRPITPAMEPYHYITHKPQATLRKVHKEELGKFWKHGRVQPMSSFDRKKYDGLWAANKGILLEDRASCKDDVANVVVKDIWQRSRLQSDILSEIYDLVDREQRGRLSRDEFVVGTWLVDHSLRGRKLPYKADLTDDLFDGGYMARLGIKLPKKLKHDEKKYLREKVERKGRK